jgi:hypothetical protein
MKKHHVGTTENEEYGEYITGVIQHAGTFSESNSLSMGGSRKKC